MISELKNVEIFETLFNWHIMEEISEIEIEIVAKKLNFPLEQDFLFKCSWNYYRKCTVFSLNRVPLLFFKYVRDDYFFEVLGLHLTINLFDSEMTFRNYLTGLFKRQKPIPYIITTYEMGVNLSNYNIKDYLFLLGRQCYLHEILALYDVFDRHFIVRDKNSLCRIDFGRCFENLQKEYLGFRDYLNNKNMDASNEEFQKGYTFEKLKISNNLRDKRSELIKYIKSMSLLEKDYILIDFEVKRFYERLITYWKRIGFLEMINISESELI
jgi:hypothetical protein